MKRGHRHLLKCRCILPQFRNMTNPPQHQFVVFSVLEDDVPVIKYSQCNNCGIIHKVTDFCKSEIVQGKEYMSSLMSVEDIKQNLPQNLVDILERNSVELPGWEQAAFLLENKEWGNFVILTQDTDSGAVHGKYVRFMSESFFKIESFVREDVIVSEA